MGSGGDEGGRQRPRERGEKGRVRLRLLLLRRLFRRGSGVAADAVPLVKSCSRSFCCCFSRRCYSSALPGTKVVPRERRRRRRPLRLCLPLRARFRFLLPLRRRLRFSSSFFFFPDADPHATPRGRGSSSSSVGSSGSSVGGGPPLLGRGDGGGDLDERRLQQSAVGRAARALSGRGGVLSCAPELLPFELFLLLSGRRCRRRLGGSGGNGNGPPPPLVLPRPRGLDGGEGLGLEGRGLGEILDADAAAARRRLRWCC